MYIYLYIYICLCLAQCKKSTQRRTVLSVVAGFWRRRRANGACLHSQTHTDTHRERDRERRGCEKSGGGGIGAWNWTKGQREVVGDVEWKKDRWR